MADPVIPGLVRAQVVLQGDSDLPEDRFVTTYVFGNQDGGSPTDTDLEGISDRLQSFWTDDPVGGTGTLASLLGGQCSGDAEVRLYRLGDTPPREPHIFPFTLTGFSQSSGMPAEVAICISYYSNQNAPRRRGRIYFGPCSNLTGGFSGGEWRPTQNTIDILQLKARDLLAAADTALWPWAVLSDVDNVARPITNGWVDNSYDTQRRRGLAPTARTLWS